jgi:hypothetical protein
VHSDHDEERRSVRRSGSQKSLGTPVLESPKPTKSLGTPILESPKPANGHGQRTASIGSVDTTNGSANGKASVKTTEKTIVVEPVALPSPKTL